MLNLKSTITHKHLPQDFQKRQPGMWKDKVKIRKDSDILPKKLIRLFSGN